MEFLKKLLTEAKKSQEIEDVSIPGTPYAFLINDYNYEINFNESRHSEHNNHHSGEEYFPVTAILYLAIYRQSNPDSDLKIPDFEVHIDGEAVSEWGDDSFDYEYGSSHGTHGGFYTHESFYLGKKATVSNNPTNSRTKTMLEKSGILKPLIDILNSKLQDTNFHTDLEANLSPLVTSGLRDYIRTKNLSNDGYDPDD